MAQQGRRQQPADRPFRTSQAANDKGDDGLHVNMSGPQSTYTGTQVIGDLSSSRPLIICFHGSGDSCESWLPLAQALATTDSAYSSRVLLYDRGDDNSKANKVVSEMLQYLSNAKLSPPYILIAHSYGGNFARDFLQRRPDDVAGMVLAETGQETPLDPRAENEQYRRRILADKPLSVIRCNTLIWKWAQYEKEREAAQDDEEKARLNAQRQFLEMVDKEDERLKKQQLRLSSNTHYVHIPDCGHGVITERPDVVAEEVQWVLKNLSTAKDTTLWKRLANVFSILKMAR